MLILIIASGPDKGRIYELLGDQPVVLGRQGDQVRLSDPRISRHHARLSAHGDQWMIEDLESAHGTTRNRQPVTGRTRLGDGDQIKIGDTRMIVARMPVEHAERAALLDGPGKVRSAGGAAGGAVPRRVNRKKVAAVAGCVAALAVVAVVAGGGGAYFTGVPMSYSPRLAGGVGGIEGVGVGGGHRVAISHGAKTGAAARRPLNVGGGDAVAVIPTRSSQSISSKAVIDASSTSRFSGNTDDFPRQAEGYVGAFLANKPFSIEAITPMSLSKKPAPSDTAHHDAELAALAALRKQLDQQQAMIAPLTKQIHDAVQAAHASAKSLAAMRAALDKSLADDSSAKKIAALSAKLDEALVKLKQPTIRPTTQSPKSLAGHAIPPSATTPTAARQPSSNINAASTQPANGDDSAGDGERGGGRDGGQSGGQGGGVDADWGLTKTQQAYKQAFETGKPVMIGQRIDPRTGKRIGGRMLNPTTARAAGVTSWRQWYILDNLVQRLTLHHLAMEVAANSEADVIRIPQEGNPAIGKKAAAASTQPSGAQGARDRGTKGPRG